MGMREIKFRVWDIDRDIMLPVDALFLSEKVGIASVVTREGKGKGIRYSSNQPKHFELMQFTGLLDKQGKEIYEGDIINAGVWGTVGYYNETSFIIEFSKGAFRGFMIEFSEKKNRFSFSAPLYKLEKVEVIGNIYENKELIKCQ